MSPLLAAAVFHWGLLAVAIWVAGAAPLIILEVHGMLHRHDGWPTLTNVVKRYVPRWLVAMLLGWLAQHFLAGKAGDR